MATSKTTKKKAAAKEPHAPAMTVKTVVALSPEELKASIERELLNIDLYDVKHNVVSNGGKVQFIAYIYGRPKA